MCRLYSRCGCSEARLLLGAAAEGRNIPAGSTIRSHHTTKQGRTRRSTHPQILHKHAATRRHTTLLAIHTRTIHRHLRTRTVLHRNRTAARFRHSIVHKTAAALHLNLAHLRALTRQRHAIRRLKSARRINTRRTNRHHPLGIISQLRGRSRHTRRTIRHTHRTGRLRGTRRAGTRRARRRRARCITNPYACTLTRTASNHLNRSTRTVRDSNLHRALRLTATLKLHIRIGGGRRRALKNRLLNGTATRKQAETLRILKHRRRRVTRRSRRRRSLSRSRRGGVQGSASTQGGGERTGEAEARAQLTGTLLTEVRQAEEESGGV